MSSIRVLAFLVLFVGLVSCSPIVSAAQVTTSSPNDGDELLAMNTPTVESEALFDADAAEDGGSGNEMIDDVGSGEGSGDGSGEGSGEKPTLKNPTEENCEHHHYVQIMMTTRLQCFPPTPM